MRIRYLFHIANNRYTASVILKWLWHAWKGNRLQATLNALLGLLGVTVSLWQVWAVQHAIDVASHAVDGSIYWAVALMGGLVLCDFAISISGVWIRNILGIRAQNRMQQKMLDRILRSEWRGKDKLHSGDVINRLENDVDNVVVFLTETIPNTLSVMALFFGAFFYLFSMDKLLSVVVVVILPLFLLISRLYVNHMRRLTREVRDHDSKVQSMLQETVQHRMLIKTMEGISMVVERLEGMQRELQQKVVKRTTFSIFSNMAINFGFVSGYLIAFLWSALRMSAGTLTFGGMTAFLQLVNKIQGPARNLTRLVPQFVSVFTAAERLMELEENPVEEQGEPVMLKSPCGIRLEGVSFMYTDRDSGHSNRLVLQDLSFDFRPGSCTAILGETGAGKTTLVRMMLALLKPQQGKVEIYSGEYHHTLSPCHRCNLVYVPQGNTLLSGTIRDNLRLGRMTASEEEMRQALHVACADFVMDLPQGLDTLCTESGGGLSEGQAQRIAIARALLREGSVMLFDEATSALDPETERQLLENILENHDKTVAFITHRPAVVDFCDQVLRVKRI